MITCVVDYTIDPRKTAEFERFARAWIGLVNKHGGQHHGYFLPAEGASDRALALFSFPSLAAYETYRSRFGVDPEFVAADKIRDETIQLQALQSATPRDETKVEVLSNQLVWETRIFEDRRKVVRFVCEVPTTIDQRLFALGRVIQQEME